MATDIIVTAADISAAPDSILLEMCYELAQKEKELEGELKDRRKLFEDDDRWTELQDKLDELEAEYKASVADLTENIRHTQEAHAAALLRAIEADVKEQKGVRYPGTFVTKQRMTREVIGSAFMDEAGPEAFVRCSKVLVKNAEAEIGKVRLDKCCRYIASGQPKIEYVSGLKGRAHK